MASESSKAEYCFSRALRYAGTKILFPMILAAVIFINPATAHAGFVSGLLKVVGGVLELPRSTLVGTFSGPPILGTAVGFLAGAVNGAGMVVGGVIETAASVVPLAMKAAPYIPIFL